MDKPFIYLAFANEGGNFLQYLQKERKSLYNTLKSYLHTEHEAEVTINDVFQIFRENRGRLAIFHYSGHARSGKFNLHGRPLRAESLESLVEQEKEANPLSLALVFLNACVTEEHVGYLQKLGVECVIATEDEIDDDLAKEFSAQFYTELVSGRTIAGAFKTSKAWFCSEYLSEDFFWQLHELHKDKSGSMTLQQIKDQFTLRTPIEIFENQALKHLSCLKLEARIAHQIDYCYRQEKPKREVDEAIKKLMYFAKNPDYLQIIVLSEETHNWKPFGEDSILELFLQFKEKSGINLHLVFVNEWEISEHENDEMESSIFSQSILILDCKALQKGLNVQFAQYFNNKYIGGLLIPIQENIDRQALLFNDTPHKNFKKIEALWKKKFTNPCVFADLEVSEKGLLFRRLKDISHYHIKTNITLPNPEPTRDI